MDADGDDSTGTAQAREQDFWGHQLPTASEALSQVTTGPSPNTVAALDALEPLGGARVLDLACGVGITSIWLAQRGARVVGVDITPRCIELAQEVAEATGIEGVGFRQCGLDDLAGLGTFDRLFGRYALHHLDIARAARALGEVRGSGPSAFLETMATNPVLRFARERLVGRFGIPRLGTEDEHPLTAGDLSVLASELGPVRTFVEQPAVARIFDRQVLRFRFGPVTRVLGALDDAVFTRPRWQHLSYEQVVVFDGDRGTT